MRPRNKYEKRVAEINATFSETIAVKDAEWFKKASKKWDFGHGHFCYFTIYTNIREFEVKRLYRGYKFTDKSTDHFFFVEIIREFSDGQKKLYFAKQRQMGGYYDCFTYSTDIELREVYTNYAGYNITELFDLSYASHSQSNGKRINCLKTNPSEIARVICDNPVAENLFKANDLLFPHLMCRTYLKEISRAITLAKRHGFVFSEDNAVLWLDMVYAMIKCKKDWHNPVYIAPKDLRATHDRFIRMLIRKQQEDEIRRKNRKAEEKAKCELDYQKMYVKARQRFFDMELKKGSLCVYVLQDLEEFKAMAEHFHNCVYSCEYWNMKKHPKSLIMVATIGGNKAELIEVNLDNYTISQCYGVCNQFTNYHKRIVRYVKSQMKTIKSYNENTNIKLRKAV